jgi:tRNA (guanine37-N1)-methyltransferase
MEIVVISLFPDMIRGAAAYGVTGRALDKTGVSLVCTTPREYTTDNYQTVDDRPYGGGPGMVLKVEPMAAAISAAKKNLPAGSEVIFLSPQGRLFDQAIAQRLATLPGMVLVAGRYEGFDERLIESFADDELSLGDFVISGGELAAAVVIDAVLRLLPGVLGDEMSAQQDSFSDGLLDCPHYTRPEAVDGRRVPQVLLEGNHAAIRRWRLKEALGRTWIRRPDLLAQRMLTDEEARLLDEYKLEHEAAGDAQSADG